MQTPRHSQDAAKHALRDSPGDSWVQILHALSERPHLRDRLVIHSPSLRHNWSDLADAGSSRHQFHQILRANR